MDSENRLGLGLLTDQLLALLSILGETRVTRPFAYPKGGKFWHSKVPPSLSTYLVVQCLGD